MDAKLEVVVIPVADSDRTRLITVSGLFSSRRAAPGARSSSVPG